MGYNTFCPWMGKEFLTLIKMKEEKIKIAMVRYNDEGKPVGAAFGDYKPYDVELFRKGGYVDVEEGLARRVDEELTRDSKMPWER